MYTFSRTPKPPENPVCPANVLRREAHVTAQLLGPHEPVELTGTDMRHVGYTISCDDGGLVIVWPCRFCGLIYLRSLNIEEHILHEFKGERRGKISEGHLEARIITRSGGADNARGRFNAALRKFVEDGTLTRTEQDDQYEPGTVVYKWNGDSDESV